VVERVLVDEIVDAPAGAMHAVQAARTRRWPVLTAEPLASLTARRETRSPPVTTGPNALQSKENHQVLVACSMPS
jgi:hypothetical protein